MPFPHRISSCSLILCLILIFSAHVAFGQTKAKESPMKGQTKELEGDWFTTEMVDEENPVKMSATFYYGNADKNTVPVLLLHDMQGSRQDFTPLIDMLVNNGYAVLAPDLRGHGKSNKRLERTEAKFENVPRTLTGGRNNRKPRTEMQTRMVSPPTQKLVDFKAEDFQLDDYVDMFYYDVELMREMLIRAHNEGMVNMNRMVVVGVGRGATLAGLLTLEDWRDRKSDRFTKTLVMIAPTDIDPRADTSKLFELNKSIREQVAVCLAAPKGDMSSEMTTKKIYEAIVSKIDKKDQEKAMRRYLMFTYDVDPEKTIKEIFADKEVQLAKKIFDFIDDRCRSIPEKEARWTKLK